MGVHQRFKIFLAEKDLSQNEFSRITGYDQRTLSNFITQRVKTPKIDLAVVMLKHFPEINLRWLFLGESEMYTPEPIPNSELEREYLEVVKENSYLKTKIITLLENQYSKEPILVQ
ncbi:MAG: helix-turn-helix domain-containing protein [Flavobacteriales bacterium]